MKLRNKIAAITAAAMLAFTGVGFAAWVFGHEATANVTVTNEVTAAVDLTGLTADEPAIKLVLDQPAKTGYNEQGKGIYWADASGNEITEIVLTPAISYRSGYDTPTYEYSFVPTFVATGLESYVAFDDSVDQSETGTFTQAAPLGTFTYTLPGLSYSAEPTTLAAYDAMVTAAGTATISLSFVLNITDNVA